MQRGALFRRTGTVPTAVVRDGPGSAKQYFVLHRVRGTTPQCWINLMTDTPNLGLPFIEGSQAQKHVTHNEALRILDAAIQISVLDLTRTAPPSSPAEGERPVVASGASGAWAGHANAIASWQDGAWAFLAPHAGWCIWSSADSVMFVFDGTNWHDLRGLSLDNAPHVGVNTTADSTNRLSVQSN